MTSREKIKLAIHAHRIAGEARYDKTLDEVEKAIDELINTERQDAIAGLISAEEIAEQRLGISRQFLAILIEKHDGEFREDLSRFDRSIAGRAVAYADDLIKTLRTRKAP